MTELRLPRLEKSFCGCSLETGSKVIGYYHLIILGFIFLLALGDVIYFEINGPRNTTYLRRDFEGVFLRDESLLTMAVNLLVFSALFLVGIYKRNSIFLEPFIWMKGTFLLMSFVHIGSYTIERVQGLKELLIFPLLASTVIEAYTLTVITSYKRQLETRELS